MQSLCGGWRHSSPRQALRSRGPGQLSTSRPSIVTQQASSPNARKPYLPSFAAASRPTITLRNSSDSPKGLCPMAIWLRMAAPSHCALAIISFSSASVLGWPGWALRYVRRRTPPRADQSGRCGLHRIGSIFAALALP